MHQSTRSVPGRAAARADGERSRERILDAAERLLSERGFSGTGIAAISRESGLPASSIYWFFANKQDLTAAVIERAADRWFEAFESGTQGDDPDFQHFLGRALEQSGSRLPDFARLQVLLALERGESDPELRERLRELLERGYALVEGVLARSFRDHGLEDAETLARELAPVAMALANGTLIQRSIDPERLSLEHFVADLEAAMVAMARRRTELER